MQNNLAKLDENLNITLKFFVNKNRFTGILVVDEWNQKLMGILYWFVYAAYNSYARVTTECKTKGFTVNLIKVWNVNMFIN